MTRLPPLDTGDAGDTGRVGAERAEGSGAAHPIGTPERAELGGQALGTVSEPGARSSGKPSSSFKSTVHGMAPL